MSDPRPVVTMDDDWRISVDGRYAGMVRADSDRDDWRPCVDLDAFGVRFAADLRAIADFLDQLEGAQ